MNLRQIIQEEIAHVLREREGLRTLNVFDLDDTLISSTSFTRVFNKRTSERKKLTPAEFSVYKPDKDDVFDFSEFDRITNGKPISRQFDLFAKLVKLSNASKTAILTARGPAATKSIQAFMKKYGISGVEIAAIGTSSHQAKADWIRNQIEKENFSDVLFIDDAVGNTQAVRKLEKEMPNINFTIKLAKM